MRLLDPDKMTRTERMHWGYAVDALRMTEHDIHSVLMAAKAIPLDWNKVWEDRDRRDAKTIRVTARLDADVVRFFRAMGPGYQPRINRVLRAFMHMRLAKLIDGPDTTDYILDPQKVMRQNAQRPEWGDMAVLMAAGERLMRDGAGEARG
jgi:uncharacterized protein (DUF4415 family)